MNGLRHTCALTLAMPRETVCAGVASTRFTSANQSYPVDARPGSHNLKRVMKIMGTGPLIEALRA
jgi:hypothetical protein